MDNVLMPNCVYEYIEGQYKGLKIRVLKWSQEIDAIYFIELEKDQAMPVRYKLSSFIDEVFREVIKLIVDPYLDCIPMREESEKVQAKIDEKWQVVNRYWKTYEIDLLEPTNQNEALKKIVAASGIKRHKIKRIFSTYMQKGMRDDAFATRYEKCGGRGKSRDLGNNKVGRPRNPDKDGNPVIGRNVTPEIDVLIDIALQKYYFKKNNLNMSDIYEKFIEDDFISYYKYLHCTDDVLSKIPNWRVAFFDELDSKNTCYIGINSANSLMFSDISSNKLNLSKKANNKFLFNHRDLINKFMLQWVMIDLPSETWATKMFPDLSTSEAYKNLCDIFININRLDKDNSLEIWNAHRDALTKMTDYLNFLKIRYLEFSNSLGTNFTLELPKNHVWIGATVKSRLGTIFTPNIPTEEVFTAPIKYSVNEKIHVVKPVYFRGKLIRDIEFTFKNEEVVDFLQKKIWMH
nr:aminopeptidase [uncultured Cellulosilyticum sp.]